ncbi:tRNA lysidine(34) synthetase TilS [Prosthecochloris sp. ZM_2]|uniref:tRNA lysidine(34) synthetase TilS n=1 Tax=Prosthecochloris sp. ZM_2 TaxID=2045206 RepID=UPI000DF7ABF0|nr:tRNA lysidine(34) synthetase TilS [Prosthecochloris sp. ZM_2]RNA64427.1 tRNA lysidine(34) synthetase TilS [Prosthecochloris sp. ZM_2]
MARHLTVTEKKFLEQLVRRGLVQKGDRLLVAVSGGPDSCALLYLLNAVAPVLQLDLAVVHCNFQLRGMESEQDEAFVRDMASRLGLSCHSRSFETSRDAPRWKKSIEETARIQRYRFFEELRLKHGFDKIVTGHHVNDNAETVLFNLFRGTSVIGLRGISERQGCIVRPMLLMQRADVMTYLQDKGVTYRTDATNYGVVPDRNYIRHRIIPVIEERFGSKLMPALRRISDNTAELEEFLERYFDRLLQDVPGLKLWSGRLEVAPLLELTIYERKEVLKRALRDLSCETTAELLSRLCWLLEAIPGKRIRVSGRIEALRQRDVLLFRHPPDQGSRRNSQGPDCG